MSTFDKVLHLIGGAAATALATCATAGVSLPAWATITLAVVAAGSSGMAAQPATIATFLTKGKKDA